MDIVDKVSSSPLLGEVSTLMLFAPNHSDSPCVWGGRCSRVPLCSAGSRSDVSGVPAEVRHYYEVSAPELFSPPASSRLSASPRPPSSDLLYVGRPGQRHLPSNLVQSPAPSTHPAGGGEEGLTITDHRSLPGGGGSETVSLFLSGWDPLRSPPIPPSPPAHARRPLAAIKGPPIR